MKEMELCQLGQALHDVDWPAAADNYTSIWGSKSYMMNSGEGISHLLREPLLTERLVLAPDFSVQVRHRCFCANTLLVQDTDVDTIHRPL